MHDQQIICTLPTRRNEVLSPSVGGYEFLLISGIRDCSVLPLNIGYIVTPKYCSLHGTDINGFIILNICTQRDLLLPLKKCHIANLTPEEIDKALHINNTVYSHFDHL
jgi:hypothetical protein